MSNIGWLFADKVLRMGIGLLVGVWLARYLGPEQFGLLNYVTAIVALFTAIATLGLNNIVVRDLVKHPEDANITLGTAFILQLIGGVLATCAAVIAVCVVRPEDTTVKFMVAIISSAMIFKASDVIRYWFEAKVQSKYTVWVENAAFLVFATVKGLLIINTASLMAFVWIILTEAVLLAALLLFIYNLQGYRLLTWRFRYARAKTLLNDSWPLILSGMAAMLYMRIDQIMLGEMTGEKDVGVYSAAVRISELWYFIPMVIIPSIFPAISAAKKNSEDIYNKKFINLFNLMMMLAIVIATMVTMTSKLIVTMLFGLQYIKSAEVLVIHIWGCIFVFSGLASARWFIIENLQKYTFYRTLAGCLINVSLNLILIPNFGVIGAAWSSVISQAFASVFFNWLNKPTRGLFYMQINAISGFNLILLIKSKLQTEIK